MPFLVIGQLATSGFTSSIASKSDLFSRLLGMAAAGGAGASRDLDYRAQRGVSTTTWAAWVQTHPNGRTT
jgi:hypothetical protein